MCASVQQREFFACLSLPSADAMPVVNTMPRLIALLLAAALTSCAGADFSPYVGAQQHWPTSTGSFVQRKYGLPIYFGPPERPYIVLGYIDSKSAGLAVWEEGTYESIKPAIKAAIQRGADAIIVLGSNTRTAGTINSSFSNWNSNTQFSGGVYGNNFSGNANTTGNAFGSSFSSQMRFAHARAIAIKFLRS